MTVKLRWALFFVVGFALGCSVALTDEQLFSCATDADCGGDGFTCVTPLGAKPRCRRAESCTTDGDCGGSGFICATPPGKAPRCCRPEAQETCNGLDDNCDGEIDEGFPAETCNGIDDNCNGQIDETFNLLGDAQNCGRCGLACTATQACVGGNCVVRGETNCGDGVDNDSDNTTDCVDTDCNNQPCGVNCSCRSGLKAETDCTNNVDDDGDGKIDCVDPDCENVACAGGCTCKGGVRTETTCYDMLDNDSDGGIDCADVDCNARSCKVPPFTFACNGNSCQCNGSTTPLPENTAAKCRNGTDDDCNGLTDCEETACNGFSCESNGDAGCLCQGGRKVEKNCADRIDNDGDLQIDCREMLPDGGGDCIVGTPCTYVNGTVKNGNCAWDGPTAAGVCR